MGKRLIIPDKCPISFDYTLKRVFCLLHGEIIANRQWPQIYNRAALVGAAVKVHFISRQIPISFLRGGTV